MASGEGSESKTAKKESHKSWWDREAAGGAGKASLSEAGQSGRCEAGEPWSWSGVKP